MYLNKVNPLSFNAVQLASVTPWYGIRLGPL